MKTLNDAIFESQDRYRKFLLSKTKEEILNHTYEHTIRNDISMAAEDMELTEAQEQALANYPDFIGEVYHRFCKLESEYMQTLRDIIEELADELATNPDAISLTPDSNADCALSIDEAIGAHRKNGQFDAHAAACDVLAQYPIERVAYVLACVLMLNAEDERISEDNKEWARGNHNLLHDLSGIHEVPTSHITRINEFATAVQAIEKATLLLTQFSRTEFGDDAELDNLHNLSICVCDSATDEALFSEVYLDLVHLKMTRWLNGVIVEELHYKNMNELNNDLEALDIEMLVKFSEAQIEKALES